LRTQLTAGTRTTSLFREIRQFGQLKLHCSGILSVPRRQTMGKVGETKFIHIWQNKNGGANLQKS
jgi:hypothetical protein